MFGNGYFIPHFCNGYVYLSILGLKFVQLGNGVPVWSVRNPDIHKKWLKLIA